MGWAIQNGITLSRSSVRYFRHNDMDHLRSILEDVERKDKAKKKPLYRRFIVVEGIYQVRHRPARGLSYGACVRAELGRNANKK